MDERWEGLQTVRCSLYLSMRFWYADWGEVGHGRLKRGNDRRQWWEKRMGGAARVKWERCNHMCYLAECCHHLCSSSMRPRGTLCKWALMDRFLHFPFRFLHLPIPYPLPFFVHVNFQFIYSRTFPLFSLFFNLPTSHLPRSFQKLFLLFLRHRTISFLLFTETDRAIDL